MAPRQRRFVELLRTRHPRPEVHNLNPIDTIVVTETSYENFPEFLPMELDDMERLVLGKAVVQKVPPPPTSSPSRRL
jgi:hypothetical protein